MRPKITSSAALAGKTLYIGDYGGRLIALSTTPGKVWFTQQGQRPDLRDAGGRGRSRLRPLLDRRQPDRLHDGRALSLARLDRLVRLLVPRRLGGTRLLRLLQRPLLLASPRAPAASSGLSPPAGRCPGPRSSSPASPTRADLRPDHRRRAKTRPRRPPLPARRVRPGLGQRQPAPAPRLLAGLGGRGALSEAAWLLGGRRAVLLVVAAGIGAAYVSSKREAAQDVRGSSTEEFVTTEEAAPRLRRRRPSGRAEVVWPTVSATTPSATRVAPFDLRPPFRRPGCSGARQPARVPARDRVRPPLLHEQLGCHVRRQREDRQPRLERPVGRCVASPARGRGRAPSSRHS